MFTCSHHIWQLRHVIVSLLKTKADAPQLHRSVLLNSVNYQKVPRYNSHTLFHICAIKISEFVGSIAFIWHHHVFLALCMIAQSHTIVYSNNNISLSLSQSPPPPLHPHSRLFLIELPGNKEDLKATLEVGRVQQWIWMIHTTTTWTTASEKLLSMLNRTQLRAEGCEEIGIFWPRWMETLGPKTEAIEKESFLWMSCLFVMYFVFQFWETGVTGGAGAHFHIWQKL